MFTYFIAGEPTCLEFGHAKFIAEKLKHSLPNFSYEVIVKTKEEIKSWLQNFCHEQKWKNSNNPLIWKRIKHSSGPCQLIGGINEFFVLLTEYYGIDTHLDKRTKKLIALDNKMRMKFMLTKQVPVHPPVKPRKVCVTGAVYSTTVYLVSELLQLKQLHTEGGVTICLHQENTKKYIELVKIKNELIEAEFNVRGHKAIEVVNIIEEGLLDCDLLIVIGDVKRKANEDQQLWMDRNYSAMMSLASKLNRYCPENCKVMMMDMELLCFNLSVLADYADKIYLHNIIGATGHYGMEMLPSISQTTGIPMTDLHCPPVWGYVGLEKYVDINHTVYHRCGSVGVVTDVPSAILHGNSANVTGPHKYLQNVFAQSAGFEEKVIDNACGETIDSIQSDCSLRCLPEIRAVLRLLSEWFEKENNTTINAAIFSDGTFGLPYGMFISQPVCIEDGKWKPNYHFPSPDKNILRDIILKATETSIKYKIGKRFNMNWKESKSKICK